MGERRVPAERLAPARRLTADSRGRAADGWRAADEAWRVIGGGAQHGSGRHRPCAARPEEAGALGDGVDVTTPSRSCPVRRGRNSANQTANRPAYGAASGARPGWLLHILSQHGTEPQSAEFSPTKAKTVDLLSTVMTG